MGRKAHPDPEGVVPSTSRAADRPHMIHSPPKGVVSPLFLRPKGRTMWFLFLIGERGWLKVALR
jgi:hypothetical protein